MKTILSLICAGVFVSAVCAGFFSCRSSGSEPEPPPPPPPPKIPQEVSFYYLGDTKIQLKVLKDRVIAKAASESDAEVLCENDIFIFEGMRRAMGKWIVASIDPEETTIEDVRELPGVIGATYGLEDKDENRYYPGEKIFVQPVKGTTIENIISDADLTEYVVSTEWLTSYGSITLNLSPEYILWASNELYETEMCEFAEPAFYLSEIKNPY